MLLRRNTANGYLRSFWAAAFPPPGPLTCASVGWDRFTLRTRTSVRQTRSTCASPSAAGAAAGRAGRARPAPAAGAAGAAAAGRGRGSRPAWPGRTRSPTGWRCCFVPLVALAVAAPVDLPVLAGRLPPWGRTGSGRRRRSRLAAVARGGRRAGRRAASRWRRRPSRWHGLADWAASDSGYVASHARRRSRGPCSPRSAARSAGPGDLLLVDGGGARFAAAFYAPRVGAGASRVLQRRPAPSPGCPAGVAGGPAAGAAPGTDRVWLVASHTRPVEMDPLYLAQLARVRAPRGRTWSRPRVRMALRFDRAHAAAAPPRPAPQLPGRGRPGGAALSRPAARPAGRA